MPATDELTPQQKVAFLARLLKRPSLSDDGKLVCFLGAGASVAGGVPTANELKIHLAKQVWKDAEVPEVIASKSARLEDVFDLFEKLGGREGYGIAADYLQTFVQPPPGYHLLVDIFRRGYLAAVVTTNFDLLLENAALGAGLDLTIASEDEQYIATKSKDSLLVAKLHGSADRPGSMRGSWTDTRKELPIERRKLLHDLFSRHTPVFVGYAAQDNDIREALRDISKTMADRRVFWADIAEHPANEIGEALGWFGSRANFISLPGESFFKALFDELINQQLEAMSDDLPPLRGIEHLRELPTVVRQRAVNEKARARTSYRQRLEGLLHQEMERGYGHAKSSPLEDDQVSQGGRTYEWSKFSFREDVDKNGVEVVRSLPSRGNALVINLHPLPEFVCWMSPYHPNGDMNTLALVGIILVEAHVPETPGTPPRKEVWCVRSQDVQWLSESYLLEAQKWASSLVREYFARFSEFQEEVRRGHG